MSHKPAKVTRRPNANEHGGTQATAPRGDAQRGGASEAGRTGSGGFVAVNMKPSVYEPRGGRRLDGGGPQSGDEHDLALLGTESPLLAGGAAHAAAGAAVGLSVRPNALKGEEGRAGGAAAPQPVDAPRRERAGSAGVIPVVCGVGLDSLSLALIVVQACCGALMARYSRTQPDPYTASTAVVCSEVVKFVVALVGVRVESGTARAALASLRSSFFDHPWDVAALAVPGVLYVVQNNLLYVAFSTLDVGTLAVLQQLKLLTTAGFSVCLLGRVISRRRWAALMLLFVGVAVVQLGAQANKPAPLTAAQALEQRAATTPPALGDGASRAGGHRVGVDAAEAERLAVEAAAEAERVEMDLWVGSVAMVTASVLSGFAGVWLEKIFKRGARQAKAAASQQGGGAGAAAASGTTSIWLRNVQLSVVGVIFGMGAVLYGDRAEVAARGFFHGYTPIVWAVVLNTSAGGLIISIAMRYADNVRKGFAGASSIVISPVLSAVLLGTSLPLSLLGGGLLVAVATALYSLPDAPRA